MEQEQNQHQEDQEDQEAMLSLYASGRTTAIAIAIKTADHHG